jgi:7-cyano-7-deazaguanine synthase
MSNEKSCVVAVSGGLDSCVTAAIAQENHKLNFVHINYGQRTEKRESRAFFDLADFYNVKNRLIIDFSHLKQIGGSSLTDSSMEISLADLDKNDIPTSYVPFRNAHILAACISWAEILMADKVFIGAVSEDSSGYPDCTPDFFRAFQIAADLGTKPDTHITIETPVIDLSKTEIIQKGIELNAPLHLTWSCYKNEDEACGVCDSCALRLRGFQQAGIFDPIVYKIKPDYINN